MRDYWVYILSNNSMVLYIGVTSNLDVRIFEHTRERHPSSFVARYNLDRLVFCESYPSPREASPGKSSSKAGAENERKRSSDRKIPLGEICSMIGNPTELILRQAQDD